LENKEPDKATEHSLNGSTQTTCDDFGWHWNNPFFQSLMMIVENNRICDKNPPAPLCGLGVSCT